MARVTVEDCVTVVPNRFELCLIANRRAQDILSGALTTLSGKEKPSVIALREIAEKLVDVDQIRKNVIESTQYKDPIIIETIVSSKDINLSKDTKEKDEKNPTTLSDNIFLEDNLNVED